MIRFILKHVIYDGETHALETMFTLYAENKELERHLTRGGFGRPGGGYEYVRLIGAEVNDGR